MKSLFSLWVLTVLLHLSLQAKAPRDPPPAVSTVNVTVAQFCNSTRAACSPKGRAGRMCELPNKVCKGLAAPCGIVPACKTMAKECQDSKSKDACNLYETSCRSLESTATSLPNATVGDAAEYCQALKPICNPTECKLAPSFCWLYADGCKPRQTDSLCPLLGDKCLRPTKGQAKRPLARDRACGLLQDLGCLKPQRSKRQANDTAAISCPGAQDSAKAKGVLSVTELKTILSTLASIVQNTTQAYSSVKELPVPQNLSSFEDANAFIAQFQQAFAATRNQKGDYMCLLRETTLRIKLNNYQVTGAPVDSGEGSILTCLGTRWSVCGAMIDAYSHINQGKYNGTVKDVIRTALREDISCLDTDVITDITESINKKNFDNKDVLQILQTLEQLRTLYPFSVNSEENSILSGMRLVFQAARRATRANP